jgi:hypothetical protein
MNKKSQVIKNKLYSEERKRGQASGIMKELEVS